MVSIYTDQGEFTQTGSEICNHINDIRVKSCELDFLAKIEENIPELVRNLRDIRKHTQNLLNILQAPEETLHLLMFSDPGMDKTMLINELSNHPRPIIPNQEI